MSGEVLKIDGFYVSTEVAIHKRTLPCVHFRKIHWL